MKNRPSVSIGVGNLIPEPEDFELGTIAVATRDGQTVVCRGCFHFQHTGDGELVVTSRANNFIHFEPGDWLGVGSLGRHEGQLFLCVEDWPRDLGQ